jgi:hypothetical protein
MATPAAVADRTEVPTPAATAAGKVSTAAATTTRKTAAAAATTAATSTATSFGEVSQSHGCQPEADQEDSKESPVHG